ncbi:DUF1800 domain-containing protein [Piscinibacter terrae]|uniref:DUF1800 domain-containing protein n=1 Tax=Piscinibacter terrae TaxID=2496871 RepID=A0A3N7IR95_9BURK|nr:DUF1800 domain-containing protein [Albitalea terrae]RQP21412.1 DUF1800 domain-containing protein [Albitalea terrae]
MSTRRWALGFAALSLLAACQTNAPHVQDAPRAAPAQRASSDDVALLDRLSFGATPTSAAEMTRMGQQAWVERQLHPSHGAALPPAIQAQVGAMTISQTPLPDLVRNLDAQRKSADAIADDDQKKTAQQQYQQELNRLTREASSRMLLRALYSPNQLQEQMTWFWFNHFNVHQYKSNIRVLVGDYEEKLRTHSLGRFRDLLQASVFHPAMVRYLDNEQNAAARINENYARELLELHTLGVDGGYTQRDVQELARVLTGLGINFNDDTPKMKPDKQAFYVRRGLVEFNPNRHDFGDKQVLGATIHGRGIAEIEQVLDTLARHPSTARFVSRKLAQYFVSDTPPAALVDRMSRRFLETDGRIAEVMRTMIDSPEFRQSLGGKFKDPVHYVVSAVRLAYDDKPILNTGPMLNWLNRLGEAPYNRQTPDGYPLDEMAWAGPGQMNTRFEVARAIGGGSAGLFKTEGAMPTERPAFPQLANPLYYDGIAPRLAVTTRQALDQANSPQEWNALLLSSPEFMHR